MGTWAIVRKTLEHCSGALLVGLCFAGTYYLYGFLFPNSTVLWWVGKIDFALAIIVPTGLAVLFLNSFARVIYDGIIAIWKGGSNVNSQSILA
jgi:hypothetical protein